MNWLVAIATDSFPIALADTLALFSISTYHLGFTIFLSIVLLYFCYCIYRVPRMECAIVCHLHISTDFPVRDSSLGRSWRALFNGIFKSQICS